MRRARSAALAAALTLVGAALAHAQSDSLRIRASRRDTIVAAATVTAAFSIVNPSDVAQDVTPSIHTPMDWSVLTGTAPMHLEPRSTELLVLSVAIPARAIAGVYAIGVDVLSSALEIGRDSVSVLVPSRRSLDVGLLDRPGFVVSGRSYEAAFLVRNRGNTEAMIQLATRSSLGAAAVTDTVIRLGADASQIVRARVRTPAGLDVAIDDVLELTAAERDDTTRASGSSRVTVIPEPHRQIDEYQRVPTQLHLRAASSDGVSPYEAFGRGSLRDGGSTIVDFLFRAPAGPRAWFGERDEYRVDFTSKMWRARLGDQFFLPSLLTASAQPGFGAGFDVSNGDVGFGGYGQQFRRSPDKGTEGAAYVRYRPMSGSRLALNFVDREGGLLQGRVGSTLASINRDKFSGEIELARSQSGSRSGFARSARFNGNAPWFTYDVAHVFADTTFTGTQRGSKHDYLTTSSHYGNLSFVATASTHHADLTPSAGVPYRERLDVASFATTLCGRVTLEVAAVGRATTIQSATQDDNQRTLRVLANQDARLAELTMEATAGRAHIGALPTRDFTDISLSARRSLSQGAVAVWANRYSGGSVTRGTDGARTLGTDLSVRTTRSFEATLSAYATRVVKPGGGWYTQVDAQIARLLPNGNSITLRARLLSGGALPNDQSVAYLEYGIPLRLPVSRLRTTGRVFGRVIDAGTGLGVPNALVRLGPQMAITDGQGQVAFGGVPGGEHRLSLSQETSFADAVFLGDPTVVVDSARTQPTTFTLAVARSARVEVEMRRYATTRTNVSGVASAADSLVDAGPLANASLVLAGERDTLYRTTNDAGKASFTDVPPGTWTIIVRGDAPAYHRFEPDRLDVTLKPGETSQVRFRLVPRRREVQVIGDGQELRATQAGAEQKPSVSGVTRTVKPNQR